MNTDQHSNLNTYCTCTYINTAVQELSGCSCCQLGCSVNWSTQPCQLNMTNKANTENQLITAGYLTAATRERQGLLRTRSHERDGPSELKEGAFSLLPSKRTVCSLISAAFIGKPASCTTRPHSSANSCRAFMMSLFPTTPPLSSFLCCLLLKQSIICVKESGNIPPESPTLLYYHEYWQIPATEQEQWSLFMGDQTQKYCDEGEGVSLEVFWFKKGLKQSFELKHQWGSWSTWKLWSLGSLWVSKSCKVKAVLVTGNLCCSCSVDTWAGINREKRLGRELTC